MRELVQFVEGIRNRRTGEALGPVAEERIIAVAEEQRNAFDRDNTRDLRIIGAYAADGHLFLLTPDSFYSFAIEE